MSEHAPYCQAKWQLARIKGDNKPSVPVFTCECGLWNQVTAHGGVDESELIMPELPKL